MTENELNTELKKIGGILAVIRGNRSKYSVAKEAGLSANQITSFENGSGNPTLKKIITILDILGCKIVIEKK